MTIKVQITSPSRALCLVLDDTANKATYNGQEISIDTKQYIKQILTILKSSPSLPPLFSTDGESCTVEVDGKKTFLGFGEERDRLLSLLCSL